LPKQIATPVSIGRGGRDNIGLQSDAQRTKSFASYALLICCIRSSGEVSREGLRASTLKCLR